MGLFGGCGNNSGDSWIWILIIIILIFSCNDNGCGGILGGGCGNDNNCC